MDRLAELEALLAAAEGHMDSVRPMRDLELAGPQDAEFVAGCARDLGRLIACLRGEVALSADELDEIDARAERASPAPWQAFLEADGGLGGCNLIWVGEMDADEPDIYLWQGDDLAPDPVWKLVAAARNEIPGLVAAVRKA
jgi:hypothetical protein